MPEKRTGRFERESTNQMLMEEEEREREREREGHCEVHSPDRDGAAAIYCAFSKGEENKK